MPYIGEVPSAFAARRGEWLVLPLHEIFGSEELSCLASAVAERVPMPYLALNPADAAGLEIDDGDLATVTVAGTTRRLPVRVRPGLPVGVAGLPAGLAGSISTSFPAWGKVAAGAASHHE